MLYINGTPVEMTMLDALRLINDNTKAKNDLTKTTKNKPNRK